MMHYIKKPEATAKVSTLQPLKSYHFENLLILQQLKTYLLLQCTLDMITAADKITFQPSASSVKKNKVLKRLCLETHNIYLETYLFCMIFERSLGT